MRDQRIEEVLEGRLIPQIKDLPLLKKIVERQHHNYNAAEILVLQSHIKRVEDLSKEVTEDIVEAFAAIEKHDLKPSTIICSVCGNVFSVNDKETSPCKHLKQLAEECKDWVD